MKRMTRHLGPRPLREFPEVMTVAEVAEVLRVSRNAAYQSVRRGEIPSFRIGRRLLVARAVLERLLGDPDADDLYSL